MERRKKKRRTSQIVFNSPGPWLGKGEEETLRKEEAPTDHEATSPFGALTLRRILGTLLLVKEGRFATTVQRSPCHCRGRSPSRSMRLAHGRRRPGGRAKRESTIVARRLMQIRTKQVGPDSGWAKVECRLMGSGPKRRK